MTSDQVFPTDQGLQKPVCVFCGSSPGTSQLYRKAAQAVGSALAHADIPLVYGGGRRGIMGVVSQAALKSGGYVHGVLPRALIERASEHTPAPGSASTSAAGAGSNGAVKSREGLGKDLLEDDGGGRLSMEVTEGMHARKLKMAQLSTGGFVVLPGGYGTYEEMMEMITWNQLGIHKVPVIILNIGNLYTPIKALLDNAVKAGFIAPANLALCQIIDLSGGEDANADESRAEEWGSATIAALKAWSFDDKVGYGLDWTSKAQDGAGSEASKDNQDFYLFTTMRYTTRPETMGNITKADIPLLEGHIERLRESHAHFAGSDQKRWGDWPGDDRLWISIKQQLDRTAHGDWRIRVLLHPGPEIEVHSIPAPAGMAPFAFQPSDKQSAARRPLILDSQNYEPSSESATEKDSRLYKTSDRRIYDEASARGSAMHSEIDHPEVLLHTPTRLLETVTSNIALYMPSPGKPDWITPRLAADHLPFLNGVMRRYLLDKGVIREGAVTVGDWEQVKRQGGRVIGFNGLRGVWEAELK